MNRLRIRLFATLRERAGTGEFEREFPEGSTVSRIWSELVREFPRLDGHRDSIAYAVNYEYVDGGFKPSAGDEVAFIPPVSGGIGPEWLGPVRILHGPIDLATLERAVASPSAGAVVVFAGTTRNENAGRRVIRLDYEAYEPMALSEMEKIARECGARWNLVKIAISHRVGTVALGEVSVAIAVAAAHRAEAFDACHFAIDRIKEIVPIWKKEHFEGGEIWVGCQTSHPPHLHRHR
jgi:molybdopterin converting factor subunit 1